PVRMRPAPRDHPIGTPVRCASLKIEKTTASKTSLEGKVRQHIPDYFLLTGQAPVVVDVKPLHRLSKPEVAFTFDWTREALESRGWKYEVWSEPPAVELENIRFLAGYRRDWLFSGEALEELWDADLDGLLLGQAAKCLPNHPEPHVRAAIHHLLWTQALVTDLDRPLGPSTRVEEGRVNRAAARVGVGTRFRYDGETVEVVEMAATTAGNERPCRTSPAKLA
ncbi:TnsA-like heteromeric transposase endonuclease subunit, partial [Streptomyces sp. NPDC006186]|uniref:TnsA-like heteromeric transposase endonuclease subunit n=1 Tax=Streptomyces sp. NPDC006186 TaxID=3155248 RepID=UPI0033BEC994